MKTQLSNAILYTFYGVVAIITVYIVVVNPEIIGAIIGGGLFVVVGIALFVSLFKPRKP